MALSFKCAHYWKVVFLFLRISKYSMYLTVWYIFAIPYITDYFLKQDILKSSIKIVLIPLFIFSATRLICIHADIRGYRQIRVIGRAIVLWKGNYGTLKSELKDQACIFYLIVYCGWTLSFQPKSYLLIKVEYWQHQLAVL